MSNPSPTDKEVEPSIMSDQRSIYSTTALLPDNPQNDSNNTRTPSLKLTQGIEGCLHKLREEDKERKAGRIEHISYDEAYKRTGYDQNGWPSEEKQKEKKKERGKGDKRFGASLFLGL